MEIEKDIPRLNKDIFVQIDKLSETKKQFEFTRSSNKGYTYGISA
jgi:hypothetical protein